MCSVHRKTKTAFSNSTGLKSVFGKLRFRDGFEGTVETKLIFKFFRSSVEGVWEYLEISILLLLLYTPPPFFLALGIRTKLETFRKKNCSHLQETSWRTFAKHDREPQRERLQTDKLSSLGVEHCYYIFRLTNCYISRSTNSILKISLYFSLVAASSSVADRRELSPVVYRDVCACHVSLHVLSLKFPWDSKHQTLTYWRFQKKDSEWIWGWFFKF